MPSSITRKELEYACHMLRKPRKSASLQTLADICGLPIAATKLVVSVIQTQPFVESIRSEKGVWLSYRWTNHSPSLIHMSFCAVVCEGNVVEGSESPAAPMFNALEQKQLQEKYRKLALERNWTYLDVSHDHMMHLLNELELAFTVKVCIER